MASPDMQLVDRPAGGIEKLTSSPALYPRPRQRTSSYVAASPVYPSTATISGPATLYGTANNGSGWGINAGVFTGGTVTARWTWDLLAAGSPRICSLRVTTYGSMSQLITIQASNDGSSWKTVVTNAQLLAAAGGTGSTAQIPIALADSGYRYWSLAYSHYHPGGYYGGLDMTAVLLWAGSLS